MELGSLAGRSFQEVADDGLVGIEPDAGILQVDDHCVEA